MKGKPMSRWKRSGVTLLSDLRFSRNPVRFNLSEFSGALGDVGTDLPLILGIILASGVNPVNVLVMFGAAQIVSGLIYGIPMPVQPLKAVAALVIAGNIAGPTIFGAGLAIGLIMMILTTTGLLGRLASLIPKPVVRGIQLGLGFKLSILALSRFVPADGAQGYVLAGVGLLVAAGLLGRRKYPVALLLVGIGLFYAFLFGAKTPLLRSSFGFALPHITAFGMSDIVTGFLVLALPQIPLSIGNSILATKQVAHDLFPRERITVRRIGTTYSVLNLILPFAGGIPVCHGSGGLVGHHAFGARTSGSVIIYGSLYLVLGLFFGAGFRNVLAVFPLPILGVILLIQGLALIRLIGDTVGAKRDLAIALLVGIPAASMPYGFLIGMVAGTAASHALDRRWSEWWVRARRLATVRVTKKGR